MKSPNRRRSDVEDVELRKFRAIQFGKKLQPTYEELEAKVEDLELEKFKIEMLSKINQETDI